MKKLMILTLAVLLLAIISTPVFAADAKLCGNGTPEDARTEQYPFASAPLSMVQIANLGLRPVRLEREFKGYNHHREVSPNCGGTWVLEVIPAGELVLVGQDGYVAYRVSCGNRLVHFAPLPPTPAATPEPKRYLRWLWQDLHDLVEWPFYGYK